MRAAASPTIALLVIRKSRRGQGPALRCCATTHQESSEDPENRLRCRLHKSLNTQTREMLPPDAPSSATRPPDARLSTRARTLGRVRTLPRSAWLNVKDAIASDATFRKDRY